MPDRDAGKPGRQPASASSEDYAVSSSHEYHPGGLGYVELVADIQHRLGRLSEAVETLKTETLNHGNKLSAISNDIHAAKVSLRIVGAIIASLLAFACWAGNKAFDAFMHSRDISVSHQSKP